MCSAPATVQWAQLQAAQLAGVGDVLAAVSATDTSSAGLVGPDTLSLAFDGPPLASGLARDCFLEVEGTTAAPSSMAPAALSRPTTEVLPLSFALRQNQPNPLSTSTRIRFDLPVMAHVTLDIFDIQGRKLNQLSDRDWPAGYQQVTWDRRDASGRAMPAGVYLYRIQAGRHSAQRKLVVLP